MRSIRRIFYTFLFIFVGLPLVYFLTALILSNITVNKAHQNQLSEKTETIYLSSNGIHLDIVLNKESLDDKLKDGLTDKANYYAFGWGDENFYLNTPTWDDLTLKNALNALFLNSTSLMHITRLDQAQPNWVAVKLSPEQLQQVNQHLLATFKTNETGKKIHLPNAGYTPTDDFYKAKGSYSLVYTCNTWVNEIFRKSGLTASYWTPVDTGLLSKWEVK